MMASYVLRENLNKLGISSIVEEANMSDILQKNGWNYSYSYQASRKLMEEKKKTYHHNADRRCCAHCYIFRCTFSDYKKNEYFRRQSGRASPRRIT